MGRRSSRSQYLYPSLVAVAFIVTILALGYLEPTFGSEMGELRDFMIYSAPWFLGIAVGSRQLRNVSGTLPCTSICTIIGLLFSLWIYTLNVQGIIIDEFIVGSITIGNVMCVPIGVGFLLGLSVGSSKR